MDEAETDGRIERAWREDGAKVLRRLSANATSKREPLSQATPAGKGAVMRLLLTFLCGVLAAGCYECNQDNCANGCCSKDGVCIVNATTDKECGTGGLACDDCTTQPGFACVSAKCVPQTCNRSNCGGCCQGFQCVSGASQSSNACGSGAQACIRCGTRQLCANGRCCGDVGAACSGSSDCCSGRTCRDLNGTKACQ